MSGRDRAKTIRFLKRWVFVPLTIIVCLAAVVGLGFEFPKLQVGATVMVMLMVPIAIASFCVPRRFIEVTVAVIAFAAAAAGATLAMPAPLVTTIIDEIARAASRARCVASHISRDALDSLRAHVRSIHSCLHARLTSRALGAAA